MNRFRLAITFSLLLAASLALGADLSKKAEALNLLSMEEASMPEAKSYGFIKDLPKNGPVIKVLYPDADKEQPSPLKLAVKFVPKDGSQVDVSTLKVECLKLVTLNITERVQAYASKDGIKVDKVNIPSGNHKIRLTIGDTRGGVTQEVFTMKVQ